MIKDTVTTIYPKYYPKEVVDFFCQLHSRENILKDIESGLVGVLVDNSQLVGTGSYKENHITRGYVTQKHEKWDVENGVVLVYEVMRKELVRNEGGK